MLPPCLLQQRGTGQRLGAHASACEPTTALGSPRQRLGAHRLVYRHLCGYQDGCAAGRSHDAPAERWSSCHVWMRLRIAKLGKSILTSRLGAQV